MILRIKNSAAECLSVGRLSNDSMKLITVVVSDGVPSPTKYYVKYQTTSKYAFHQRLGQTTQTSVDGTILLT
ncbi:hypothetical protein Ocin01_15829 [Orchesella cincta]|uniref:Uncharacterized protein n=1 Tax=Orchesella cincta TaxID=48709 RepID=A0A1D2MD19_ORCCI|nr:hypothetical protein Ocin01_15829 [Orchesella cincta]